MQTKAQKEFIELGYNLLKPINEKEAKDNIYHLYKDGCYVASIKKMTNGKFSFNGKSYSDKKELLESISEYNKTLEFGAETYDPDIRDEYRTEARIYGTIRNFGFKRANWSNKLVSNGILGMHYGTIYDQQRLVVDANSWIDLFEDECKTDEEKCANIRSILFALYASNVSKLCELLQNTGKLRQLKDIKLKRLNENTLETEEVSMLEDIKGTLEKGLSILDE